MMVSVKPAGVPLRILIVDDDEATLRAFRLLLERANFEVVTATNFNDARFALTQNPPDLLITDIRLGEYNGLQLVATSSRSIPAIIVTGYPDTVLEAEAHRLGAEYLVKPISAATLMNFVRAKAQPRRDETVTRRWERKRLTRSLPARVNDHAARIVDISYGGLQVEVECRAEQPVPASFTLDLPDAGLSVPVDVVWKTKSGEKRWLCGGAVSEPARESSEWHHLVDAIS
jgi:DNA-binding response OmpR family regulator